MTLVVRCCVLLMGIWLSSHSSLASFDTVTVLKGDHGSNIKISCATENSPQDGVYMLRRKLNESNPEEVFYYYKDGTFTPKTKNVRVAISGQFPRLTATLTSLTVADIGLYWCKFNLEEKVTNTLATLLWVTENTTIIYQNPEKEEDCQLVINRCGPLFYCQYLVILCGILALCFIILLCIFGCIYVKVKRSCKSDTPLKPSSDSSIYEEMTRNRLDTASTLINPAYQSTKRFP